MERLGHERRDLKELGQETGMSFTADPLKRLGVG